MKKLLFIPVLLISINSNSQFVRKELKLPDIEGYKTLACDFHVHTVFSDGQVWPTTRVEEAWSEGLDAIAITDHIEYQPHKEYIPINHNAGYEIAKWGGDRENLIIIHGSEVTRSMPPGHLNAIFIKDSEKLQTESIAHMHSATSLPRGYLDSIDRKHQDYLIALKEAKAQGGFIFWNHPGWYPQAREGIKIYEVQKDLIKSGLLNGIEVANTDEWYPEAMQWCLDYNLTMLSNSDVHDTEGIYQKKMKVLHHPATLVFAKERTQESIREALDHQRTLVWFNNMVIGKKELAESFFNNMVEVSKPYFMESNGNRHISLKNLSDIPLDLNTADPREKITLLPQSSVNVIAPKDQGTLDYEVMNFYIGPKERLKVSLAIPK
ncbi:MAG TPA: Sb-PDE family phosphodiesterase [Cyclobacteriaceae bacterium]|nr:Sb-PDE family phosphodiesterase [Cyclobacteriaceae bacterium]